MERQIKFNAWVPELQVMLYEVTVYPSGMIGLHPDSFEESCKEFGCTVDYDDERAYRNGDESKFLTILSGDEWIFIEPEHHIKLQFTGLQLKGKDIYDGSILGGYPHGTVAVRWNNEYACFECYWVEMAGDSGETIERSSLLANELDDCKDEWEVLGNIHEDPALLSPETKGETKL